MRQPSTPNDNGHVQRPRNRGAIRTHLGRKRTGRNRSQPGAYAGMHRERRAQEDLFDRLLAGFQSAFAVAGESTAQAFDAALDAACDAMVNAGEFTAENAERLRQYLRRDLLQRDHPAMTFRSGDITTAGTLTCESCGWTVQTTRTTLLPPCPQCGEANFRKSA